MPHLMANSAAAKTVGANEKVYVVHRTSGFPADGFHAPMPEEHTTDSAYLSEDQAYAAAIRRQIAYMERITGDTITELRTLVTNKGQSLKDRFEKMREWIDKTDWFVDSEVVEYHVDPCPLARLETVDTDTLLDGLEEQEYTTEGSSEEDAYEEEDHVGAGRPRENGSGKKRRRDDVGPY